MRLTYTLALVCLFLIDTSASVAADQNVWKAGAASAVITPEGPIWMAGYASRNKPSEGVAQDLFAKALAIEYSSSSRLVIVTLDLIRVPRPMRDFVAKAAEEKHKLQPASLLMNCSHTHSGPLMLTQAKPSVMFDLSDEEFARVEKYTLRLQTTLVELVGRAIADLAPSKVGYSHARAGFAMNRRLPTDKGYTNSPYPDGPVDHDVPVLRVESPDGKLRAVLFGYACHNTTLSLYDICGDYAGYAQQYLEAAHPGTTAMFLNGCSGDQNPYPRGKLEQAQQHGRSLANAVEAALLPKPRALSGTLRTAFRDVTLDFAPPPSREKLQEQAASRDAGDQRKAKLLLEELDKTGRINTQYPYPVQAVQFGNDLTLVALGGEVVVDFSLRLKRELAGPSAVWVAGYSNDVFGYVPSLRVLHEGGYEAGTAFRYSPLPGPFAPTVEERIMNAAHELVRQVRTEKKDQ